MSDVIFADGIFFYARRDNAPDYVLGSISVKPEAFSNWVLAQKPDAKGYVRLAVKMSKAGKPYVSLDTWEPSGQGAKGRGGDRQNERSGFGDLEDDDIPFN